MCLNKIFGFLPDMVLPKIVPKLPIVKTKESNSTANESKRHYNRSIIYYLNIAPIVNDSFWNSSKKRKVELPGLELTAGEVFRSCQSWTLYHCATKLRHLIWLKFLFKNVSFMDYWQNCCLYYCNSVFYSHIPTLVFTVTTLLRY